MHGEVSPEEEALLTRIAQVVREENRRLLQEHQALKPLMSIQDLSRTLGKSVRWIDTAIQTGEVPPPIWIGGTRRWHPDAVDAYLYRLERKKR